MFSSEFDVSIINFKRLSSIKSSNRLGQKGSYIFIKMI